MNTDYGQVEIYSDGSTHTLYEFCGFDGCREMILSVGLGVQGNPFDGDEFALKVDGKVIKVTVRKYLDDSDSCVWCYGCGMFLRHADASPDPETGEFQECECDDPEADRESMRPTVGENGTLELKHW